MTRQHVQTTVYSLHSAPPGAGEASLEFPGAPLPGAPDAGERRSSERQVSLFRVGLLRLGEARELCLIKNISAGGMMVRAYGELPLGAPVEVELKTGEPIAGTVGWINGENAGVFFDQPIDVLDLLAPTRTGPRPRMPRLAVDVPLTLRHESRLFRLVTLDVSQGGIKARGACALVGGEQVVVSLSGLAAEPGTVRWCADGQVGVGFHRPLPLAQLVAWLRAVRGEWRAAG